MVHQGTSYWAQFGWLEYAFTNRKTFIQVKNPGVGLYHREYGAKLLDSITNYATIYDASGTPDWFRFEADGINEGNREATFTPTTASLSSEINSYSNQMPGATFKIETFTNSQWRTNAGWQTFNGSGFNANWNLWGLTIPPGGTTAGTWEKACSV